MEHWTRCIDDGANVDVVYLDFQKAFDKVPHKHLLSKLQSYGLKGMVLNWITDFLSNRKQRVVVRAWNLFCMNGCKLPVGFLRVVSLHDPTLFIIYVNNLPDCVQSFMGIFADDTKIYHSIISPVDYNILQE